MPALARRALPWLSFAAVAAMVVVVVAGVGTGGGGHAPPLSDAERAELNRLRVVFALWESDTPLTPEQIRDAVNGTGGPPISAALVRRILGRWPLDFARADPSAPTDQRWLLSAYWRP